MYDKLEKQLLENIIPWSAPTGEKIEVYKKIHSSFSLPLNNKLYRYRKCTDSNMDAFKKNEIYMSEPANFNDPYDCLPHFNMEKLHSEKNGLIVQTTDHLTESINKFVSKAKNEAHIACFSETYNSTLMWAHYADSHKGFVIEYDANTLQNPCLDCLICQNDLYKSSGLPGNMLFPVIYSDSRFDCTDLIVRYNKNYNFGIDEENEGLKRVDMLISLKINLFKGLDWKYEKEWRFFEGFFKTACTTKCQNIKPTAIYLGCKIADHNKIALCEYAKNKEIAIFQMKVDASQKEYPLIPKLINNM